MAQIDAFVKLMHDQGASAPHLAAGQCRPAACFEDQWRLGASEI